MFVETYLLTDRTGLVLRCFYSFHIDISSQTELIFWLSSCYVCAGEMD